MTIKNDVILWDSGKERLSLFKVPTEQQYKYVEGFPCITFGISYENAKYKGCDIFTSFDKFYSNTINIIEEIYRV